MQYFKRRRYTEQQASDAISMILDDARLIGQDDLAEQIIDIAFEAEKLDANTVWACASVVWKYQIYEYGCRRYTAAVRKAKAARTRAQRKAAASL